MDWTDNFYSKTGKWWGPAEAKITDRDHRRVQILQSMCGSAKTVLELGSGYGNTAAVTADAGFEVVANELSERIEFSKKFAEQELKGPLKFIKGDFYTTDLGGPYDAVVYWNGFGIGSDEDQRKLLLRIANEWLSPSGKALIDIGNPFVRASWSGDEEHKDAKPELGYEHTIEARTDYDPIHNRFIDTWWEEGNESEKLTQTLRNYSPADLQLLLEGTGLELETILVDNEPLDLTRTYAHYQKLLKEEQEYVAVLVRES